MLPHRLLCPEAVERIYQIVDWCFCNSAEQKGLRQLRCWFLQWLRRCATITDCIRWGTKRYRWSNNLFSCLLRYIGGCCQWNQKHLVWSDRSVSVNYSARDLRFAFPTLPSLKKQAENIAIRVRLVFLPRQSWPLCKCKHARRLRELC